MLAIGPQTRIFVVVEPVDFRNGIDGLGAICRERLKEDPLTGAMFVFRARSGRAIKILAYDGQGFWLCTKRLSQGRFQHWPQHTASGTPSVSLLARELLVMVWNGDYRQPAMAGDWRKIEVG